MDLSHQLMIETCVSIFPVKANLIVYMYIKIKSNTFYEKKAWPKEKY